MSQTYYDHPKEKRFTWFSGDGSTKKVLDYVLVEPFIQNYIEECKAEQNYDFDSDHLLVKTVLKTPSSKKALKISIKKKNSTGTAKPDIRSLEREDIRKTFVASVSHELVKQTFDNDNRDALLVKCLESAAQSTLPKLQKRTQTKEIWKDDKVLNELIEQRKNLTKDTDEYKIITKNVKKRVRHLRNQKLDEEAKQINQFSNKNNIQDLFRSFKNDSSAFKEVRSRKGCEPDKLKTFFKKHFTSDPIIDDPIELTEIPEYLKALQEVQTDGIYTGPPSETEIRSIIRKQKSGKATRYNNMAN